MFDVAAENIRRGIRYTYFVPDISEVRVRVEAMQRALGSPDLIDVIYIEPQAFLLLPEYDLVIYYDPLCERSAFRMAFLEAPIDNPRRLHIRLRDDVVDELVDRLLRNQP